MSLQPRAAAIRGDDYQHSVGWLWAVTMLTEADIESVTIEHPGGGAFDDVVVKRRSKPSQYIQAKSSNFGSAVIDSAWLCTALTDQGRSPLQRFFDTHVHFKATGEDHILELWTNRNFDHNDEMLQQIDLKFDTMDVDRIRSAGPRSALGRKRDEWCSHLAIDVDALSEFLVRMLWKHPGSELDLHERAKAAMREAGLRTTDDAIQIGIGLVRGWVTAGRGPRTAADVKSEAANTGLLAQDGQLILHIDGIDRTYSAVPPTLTLDFVDRYTGSVASERKQLRDVGEWDTLIKPELDSAANALKAWGVQHVHITGSVRHPMWFAVGQALPRVSKWVLSMEQVGGTWSTDVEAADVEPHVINLVEPNGGDYLAVAVGLTHDLHQDVHRYLAQAHQPLGGILTLGPVAGKPGQQSVASAGYAMGWANGACTLIRQAVSQCGASHIHLFTACPAGVALILGHVWNMMPATTFYEFVGGTYEPTVTIPRT